MIQGILYGLIGGILVGALIGYILYPIFAKKKIDAEIDSHHREIESIKKEHQQIVRESKEEAKQILRDAENTAKEQQKDIAADKRRLVQKEESLDKRYENLEKKVLQLDEDKSGLQKERDEVQILSQQMTKKLEEIAKMSSTEAKDELLGKIEEEIKEDAAKLIREVEAATKEHADQKAREIVAIAMQRVATEHVHELTTSTIKLSGDDMKGRIIGREGRNIRALEKATGVDYIIDDTPETIVISSFDPVRREVAKQALESLIKDGRIHPARIEETVAKAQKNVHKAILKAGQDAAVEAKVPGLRGDIIKYLGTLKYRFSFGQSVLTNCIETAHIAATIASEMGADVELCRKAGLLHDIGKSIDHKVDGGHATIGADLLEKLGFGKRVVYAVRAHHEDVPLKSPEDFIVQVADAISGARPGARHGTVENYIERLTKLEEVATSVKGVQKAFAIQAGREIRIMVNPDEVDDLGAKRISIQVAKDIEQGLEYPGQIKVNVIRETRAVEYAK